MATSVFLFPTSATSSSASSSVSIFVSISIFSSLAHFLALFSPCPSKCHTVSPFVPLLSAAPIFFFALPSRPSPLDWSRAHYGAPCSAYNAPATVPPLFLATPPYRRTRLRTCMSTSVTLMTHERIITEPTGTSMFSLASLAASTRDASFKCRLGYRKLTSR